MDEKWKAEISTPALVINYQLMEKNIKTMAKFAKEHKSIGVGILGLHSYMQSKMIPFESIFI